MTRSADPGFTRTVYARVYPETRAVVDALWGERPHHLYADASTGWQDPLGQELLERWSAWAASRVSLDAGLLPVRHATAGSTEAIRETLALHAVRARSEGRVPRVHVFEGEYEGYEAQALGYGIDVVRHRREAWASSVLEGPSAARPGDRFYVSQPSALDGNLWDGFDAFLETLAERLPRVAVMLDLAYVGCVAGAYRVRADLPNVAAAFFSLSKPFGVYYHRIGGVLSRDELPGLAGNKWFKNLFSIELGNRLLDAYGVDALARAHRPDQLGLLDRLGSRLPFRTRASDVVLLATAVAGDELPDWARAYVRAPDAPPRFCLTPLLEDSGA